MHWKASWQAVCFVKSDWKTITAKVKKKTDALLNDESTQRHIKKSEDVFNGCPTTVKRLPLLVQPYWTFGRSYVKDSLLLKGQTLQGDETFYQNFKLATKVQRRANLGHVHHCSGEI